MQLVLFLALIFGSSIILDLKAALQRALLGGAWLAALVLAVILPQEKAMRILGWDWRGILVASAIALLIYFYSLVIARFRKQGGVEALREQADLGRRQGRVLKARSEALKAQESLSQIASDALPVPVGTGFKDSELDRYARHIMLREIGGAGQRSLREAKVLVIGAGGLGAPVCLYLAGAGVGHLTIADDDIVELSNLHRQVIFTTQDAAEGLSKAQTAVMHMAALNPNCDLRTHQRRIEAGDAVFLSQFDLVIDGTDSHASRAGINRGCVAASVPLLAGSIAQWDGQITVYDPAGGAPCMECLFPVAPSGDTVPDCTTGGVAGPLPGVIGTMMAMEAVKMLTGAGQDLRGRLLIWSGLSAEARVIKIARDPLCAVCGSNAAS